MDLYPNLMMRACNCLPWIEECLLFLQALRAKRKEKLSMELKMGDLFLNKDLKCSNTLVWLLHSRYFLRVWFDFGGLPCHVDMGT